MKFLPKAPGSGPARFPIRRTDRWLGMGCDESHVLACLSALFARRATARVALAWRIFFAHSGWRAREILAPARLASPRLDSSAGRRTNGRWKSQAQAQAQSQSQAAVRSQRFRNLPLWPGRASDQSARSERATAQRLLLPSSPFSLLPVIHLLHPTPYRHHACHPAHRCAGC